MEKVTKTFLPLVGQKEKGGEGGKRYCPWIRKGAGQKSRFLQVSLTEGGERPSPGG